MEATEQQHCPGTHRFLRSLPHNRRLVRLTVTSAGEPDTLVDFRAGWFESNGDIAEHDLL